MNCYQVGAVEVVPGLPAMRRPHGWVVKVGFSPCQEAQVARHRGERCDWYMEQLEKRSRGSTRFVDVLDEDGFVPPEVAAEAVGEVQAGGLVLRDLDWDPRKELLVDRRGSRAALFLVTVCVNRESALQYYANTFDEVKRGGNTVRVNRDFSQATGVHTCAMGVGFYGEPMALLRVDPGSGFRLKQTRPFEGGWRELSITWNGREMNARPFPRDRARA